MPQAARLIICKKACQAPNTTSLPGGAELSACLASFRLPAGFSVVQALETTGGCTAEQILDAGQ